ncbi:hypothetical protein B0H16DRAFT_1462825 [Mycena metata]|uniref:Uncharacterized protein n=1 Tax=Mycena metata TaxID=1033252 RepID=A0AAD7N3V2_9AGAR|nr:hypothetical protein B0H16DRAFT_1462825 [Mycena metata]
MACKRKRNEGEAPPAPEEDDELEEEEEDPGAGDEAVRLQLEATQRRKCEYMRRKRARDGEEEKAKSKVAMRNFRSGLSGKAKADYLARQNQYKATYRQRKTEGTGPALRGRRIEDDPEDEDEPEDEGAEERSRPRRRRARERAKDEHLNAGRKRKHANDADVDPPAVESEEEQEVQARHPKKPAKVPARRKVPAEGEMPDHPTTEEETEYHTPPPLSMSLRRPPAPPQPAPPASSAPKPTKTRKYHTVRCAHDPRCRMGHGGQIPVEKLQAKHFSWSKWMPKYGNHFVTAQGEPVDEATFNSAMVNLCSVDLVYYRVKFVEQGNTPGFLDTYLTEDEEPQEEEQSTGGIDLDTTEVPALFYPQMPFGLEEEEHEEPAEGFFDPNEPLRRSATPTLGDIDGGPSRSPSPFPVSPERNALASLIDYGSPEELLDWDMPDEELKVPGEEEAAEATRLAKLRQNVHAAALKAYRASSQYDQRFNLLLYKPTAPTNLNTYDANAGKQWSTGEILQIKKEMAEGFEEGASEVASAPSPAMDPLPEGWWELPQMPWTEKDYADREKKVKDGTWRRAFDSGQFFVADPLLCLVHHSTAMQTVRLLMTTSAAPKTATATPTQSSRHKLPPESATPTQLSQRKLPPMSQEELDKKQMEAFLRADRARAQTPLQAAPAPVSGGCRDSTEFDSDNLDGYFDLLKAKDIDEEKLV